jgi:hypothetical protein
VAIWQFKVLLIPASWLDKGGSIDSLFEEDGYDVSIAWRHTPIAELEETFSAVLPLGKSWSAELASWGKEQGDDIQLWRKRGRVSSLGVRFDLRSPNMAFFQSIVEIAGKFPLAILVPSSRRMVESNLKSLLRAAAESDAAHFVVDPQSFLSRMEASNAKAI